MLNGYAGSGVPMEFNPKSTNNNQAKITVFLLGMIVYCVQFPQYCGSKMYNVAIEVGFTLRPDL